MGNKKSLDGEREGEYFLTMTFAEKMSRYGFYFVDLEKISAVPLWKHPTVRELKLSQKTIKRAYKEMKELDFEGNIIDYLCSVVFWNLMNFTIPNLLDYSYEDNEKFCYMAFSSHVLLTPCAIRLFLKNKDWLAKIIHDDFCYYLGGTERDYENMTIEEVKNHPFYPKYIEVLKYYAALFLQIERYDS